MQTCCSDHLPTNFNVTRGTYFENALYLTLETLIILVTLLPDESKFQFLQIIDFSWIKII